MVMSMYTLLRNKPQPDIEDIREALGGMPLQDIITNQDIMSVLSLICTGMCRCLISFERSKMQLEE